MDKVFDAYSLYYDLLYKDKDYAAETNYVSGLIKEFNPFARTILELGCGTGKHAVCFAAHKFSVHGIDQSETMLHKAKTIATDFISFEKADIRNYTSPEKYDVVISLFHVMSYMTDDPSLCAVFKTAKNHLLKNGLFIFDCWHGPAVIHDPPVSRSRVFEDAHTFVKRISTPEVFPAKNRVDVHFKVNVKNKHTSEENVLKETHSMRYLFPDELDKIAAENNFETLRQEEWLSAFPLSDRSWNGCYVYRLKT